jgi:hypothetical protein
VTLNNTDDPPVVPPPATITVDETTHKPILYLPNGTPLVRRPCGFDTRRPNQGGTSNA